MQVAQTSFLSKTNRAVTAAVKSTSCNRGWLQIFTHIICGTFTVTSFIMILMIALQILPRRPPVHTRCHVTGCRVICHEAPYYDEFEDDIILAVMEAEMDCQNVFLSLIEPAFVNETLPPNFLSRLRSNVYELGIISGNLHYISGNSFSAPFARDVKILFLENITITSWPQDMLVGLASLENLFITDCVLLNVEESALSPVSQTLEALTIMKSGHWDPEKFVGRASAIRFPKLMTVDFSYNVFGPILGNNSFTRLRFCKSLYLSYSRITYIGPGAFDGLRGIEYLNLNNNFLKTVEPRLFRQITSPQHRPRVRINLMDNLWHCDCAVRDLRQLADKGVLLAEPLCRSPDNLRGKTFSEFNYYCQSKEPRQIVVVDIKTKVVNHDERDSIYKTSCPSDYLSLPGFTPVLVSPFHEYECATKSVNISNTRNPSMILDFYDTLGYYWIKPTLVIRGNNFTMIELGSSGLEGYGLVWYRTSCPYEVFCVNIVPEIIRLYNMNLSNQYTFCPIQLPSGDVKSDQCIAYITPVEKKSRSMKQILMYCLIAVTCLFFGALFVYIVIRKYPGLLRGSKRVLFVKHKTVDALVLPPKVPLRGSLLSDGSLVDFNDMSKTAGAARSDFAIGQLARANSVRSNHSYAPSYISALQPTEEQLADWRLKHGNEKFEGDYQTISTISSDVAPISVLSGSENLYFSLDESSHSSISISNSLSFKQSISLY